MGPMKHYSCRSTERTIKSFTSDVRSTTHPGVNTSNLLLDRVNANQHGLQEAISMDEEDIPSAAPDSFIELPMEDGVSPQLWDPYKQVSISTEDEIMPDLPGSVVSAAIRSYYRRLYPTRQVLPLEPLILIAGRMWSDSITYSSRLYRTKKHLVTRADNYVLFEAGVHGR